MKRAVIFSNDMEPITVVEFSELYGHLNKHKFVVIPVYEFNKFMAFESGDVMASLNKFVKIRAELFHRNGKTGYIYFADNDETALLLESVFLPGQYKEVHDIRQDAIAEGLLKAFLNYGK